MDQTLMTEVVLPGMVSPAGFQLHQRSIVHPGAAQALVRVEASGISFAEQQMRRGRYPGQPRFPFVPGYDLVGTVLEVGYDVDPALIGRRVAVATKTGSWTTHALVTAADLIPVPATVDPAEAEAVIVNGLTAWQMLHRSAHVTSGQTILVHGANGGVGSILVQLARQVGVRVIGTASPRHHDALRQLGVHPLDYRAPDLVAQIKMLAPDGVDAAFDHLGLASARRSFRLLATGGTLVAYGMAADVDSNHSVLTLFVKMISQIVAWTVWPNGRRATFYDFWGGKLLTPTTFRAHQQEDLGQVLQLLAQGVITPYVAARFPLSEIQQAMEMAESRAVMGKVVLML